MSITKLEVLLVVAATALAAMFLSGCGNLGDKSAPVVATTTQVADFVRQIAKGKIQVTQIVSPNTEVHEFEPKARDAASIESAKIVFASGAGIDTWINKLVSNSGNSVKPVILFSGIPYKRRGPDGEADPHWWHDPRNVSTAAAQIASVLGRTYPQYAATFKRNADHYKARLTQLDTQIRNCVSQIPQPERKLVTNHDALGYFASHYGLTIIGALIPSLSTEAQPSSGQTDQLVKQIERARVRAVFSESTVNPKLAQAVASEAGAKMISSLYADSLGPANSSGATYLGSMQHNTVKIVAGLAGKNAAARCGRKINRLDG